MEQINQLLVALETKANNSYIDIFIPSVNKTTKIKGLTAKQHKDIIATAAEKTAAGISLQCMLYNIIKENTIEHLTILSVDRPYILTKLRAVSLSPILKDDDKIVDLNEVVKNTIAFPDFLKTRTIEVEDFKINATVPTIDRENIVNRETRRKLTNSTDSKDILGEIYINEFIKYINSVTFNYNDTTSTINFEQLSVNQIRNIVEKMPLIALTRLVDYINETKDASTKFSTLNGQPIAIDLDHGFFTI